MSGIEDPGTPPDLPEEYAEVYREAYLRALEEEAAAHQVPVEQEAARHVAAGAPDSSSGRWWLIAAAATLVLVIAAYLVGEMLAEEDPVRPGSQPTATTSRSNAPPPASDASPAWEGSVLPVAIEAAAATCTAPPGVDSSNNPVSYAAEHAIDDDASTAWRCNGKARGETLTFTLPDDIEVAELGLVPGYAKIDPTSGSDRYAENNRITRVRWTLQSGVVIEQELDPSPQNRSMQTIRVPRTATGTVTLEILSVAGGARNTTAISSVLIAAAY